MNPKPTLRTLAAAACALPLASLAQTASQIPQLEHVVVTPSRIAQLEKETLGDVTVIDSKELEQAGQSSLAEVLSRHHGIEMYNSGGPQTATGVFLRGTNANQTLVLVDGLRINGSTTGSVNWNAIDPANIDRVEIVRGAASSLYGSDAIGGVINIITKKSGADRPLSAYANMGLGSYNTFKSSLGLSGASSGWDYALATSLADSGGYSVTSYPGRTDNDGYTQHTLSASLGYKWRPGHHLGITAYNGYTRGDTDAYFATPEPALAITRQEAYSLTSTDDITDFWQSVLRFGFTRDAGDNRDPDSSSTFGSLQRMYTWQNNLKLSPGQQVSLVLERREERTLGSQPYLTEQRNTNAAGLIYRGNFGAHHVQASVRNDNISGYGNQTTGGLAYDFDINDQWRIGVAGNTGFKAPTFADLYYPLSAPYYDYKGNPDLKPEKSRNIEASLRYQTETTKLAAVVYQNKIRDLVSTYVCQSYAGGWCVLGRPENVNEATIRGLTLTAEQRFGATTVRANADFVNPKDDSNGNQLVRRARQVYRLNADHRINQWVLGGEYMFVGKRYDDGANKNSLGGYGLLNLTASYDFTKNVAVQVRWNNVLNKEYSNALYNAPYGYNTAGSNVFVNLAVRM